MPRSTTSAVAMPRRTRAWRWTKSTAGVSTTAKKTATARRMSTRWSSMASLNPR